MIPTDEKGARAEAKAARARAKALRPWYRKKRWWALGALTAVIVISAVAGASGGSKSPSSPGPTTGVSSLSTNSAYPPPADVSVTGCSTPDVIGVITVTGTILNHSPKASDYIIQGSLIDSKGTHVGDWTDAENNIGPGQSANFSADGSPSNPSGAVTCKVVSVDRTAAVG